MNKKNLYLITAILASVLFAGFLGETEPQIFFGYSVNIWVFRIAWLVIAIVNIVKYFKIKKLEQ